MNTAFFMTPLLLSCVLFGACTAEQDLGERPGASVKPPTSSGSDAGTTACDPTSCTAPHRTVCAVVDSQVECSCNAPYVDNGAGDCIAPARKFTMTVSYHPYGGPDEPNVTVTMGDPQDSTLACTVEAGNPTILGQNANWKIVFEFKLASQFKAPGTLTTGTYPSSVAVSFENGAGLAHVFANNTDGSDLVVKVTDYTPTRIAGTFRGTLGSFSLGTSLSIASGSFDLPIGN